jgi:hypothetical protein
MQFGRHSHREIPRIWPLRFRAPLPAPFDIVGDRIGEGSLQLFEGPPLEGQYIPRVDYFTVEQCGLFIQFNGRHIS